MTTTKKPKKCLTVVTYLIALVCLVLGLVLPFCKDANGDNKMLAMMIPSALGELLGGNETLLGIGASFANSCDVNFFGLVTLDLNALAILVYAVFTVIGVIMLIPVFASKKKTPAAACSYVVEVGAFIALFIYVFNTLGEYTSVSSDMSGFTFDWPVIAVAFGGTFLMLIIQAIANYKGSGVLKIVVWLLGAVGVFSLIKVTAVASVFKGSYGSINGLFAVANGTEITGFTIIKTFVQATYNDGGYFLFSFGGTYENAVVTALTLSLSIAGLLALVNFIIDTITLSAKTTKGGVIFDCVRYLIEVIAAVVGLVLLFVIDNYNAEPGILLYVLTAVAIICAVISIIRSSVYSKEKAGKLAGEPAESYYTDDTESSETEEYAEPAAYEELPPLTPAPAAAPAPAPAALYIPVYPSADAAAAASAPAPAPAPEPAPAPAPADDANAKYVYKVKEVYNGPTDSFISRLTESEKIEFAKLFIEKINGSYENVPDYVIGEENRDFFAAIFIYLGKFRPILSDGLMNKIYNELNLLGE